MNPDQTGPDGKWIYIYDAWNRLVEVRVDAEADEVDIYPRATFQYNGLQQRTVRTADESGNGAIDTRNHFYYDASWRLLEERVDDDYDGSTFTLEKIIQRIWCPLYIDALIAMQTDVDDDVDSGDPDGDFTDADAIVHYAVCDRKYDVIAMMNEAGKVVERVRYTAYGVARHEPSGDVNGDGSVVLATGSDSDKDLVMTAAAAGADIDGSGAAFDAYDPDLDLDRDGVIDGDDYGATYFGKAVSAIPLGQISKIGNTIGYSGYVYDKAVNASLARLRWYDAETGRWLSRDFAPYLDGSNLYAYLESSPLESTDPYGLAASCQLAANAEEDQGERGLTPNDRERCCRSGYRRIGKKLGGLTTCCKGQTITCVYWHPDSRRGPRQTPAPHWKPAEKMIWK